VLAACSMRMWPTCCAAGGRSWYKQRRAVRMLQGIVELAHGMHENSEDAMCCRQRAERLANRATALVPTLQELERVVSTSMIGEPLSTVKSLSVTMVLIAKVGNATHHGPRSFSWQCFHLCDFLPPLSKSR
jgi:hypothetical protein